MVVAFGVFTLAAQTVLFREYLVACNGGEIAIGLFFASWFLWIAVGALLHRRIAPQGEGRTSRLLLLLALYPPAAAVQWFALRSLRALAAVPASEVFPVGPLAGATVVVNAPVGLLTGLAFPLACSLVARAGEAPGRAATRGYVLEAVGSFLGGLAATLLILTGTSPLVILCAAACVLGAAGASLSFRSRRIGLGGVLALQAVVALTLVLAPLTSRLEGAAERARVAHALPGLEHLASVDTPYRHLVLGERDGQLVVLSDGTPLASLPAPEADIPTAALLMAQHPDARRIGVVGQGAEGLVAELLRYRPERLAYLQPDERAALAVGDHLPPALSGALRDPVLQRVFGDPRRSLARIGGEEDGFDLLVLDLGDPTTAAASRLATVEFHRVCRAALAPDGLLVTHITATENTVGDEGAAYGAGALLTLRETFPDVALLPGETTWLVAGDEGGPTADPGELARRYASLPASRQRVPLETFGNLVDERRVTAVLAAYEAAARTNPGALRSEDVSPVAYFLQLRVLAHTTGSPLAAALGAARRGGVWLFVLPLLVACLVSVRRALLWPDPEAESRRAGTLVLGLAGAAAMALQVCLILSFQIRFGDLFAQVGWLNALFMAGLAAGGVVGARWMRARGLQPAVSFCGAAVATCLLASQAMPWLQATDGGWVQGAYYLLILVSGTVFGAGFPVAGGLASRQGTGVGRLGALLESADHWGAAAGAALVGVAMIPLLGPPRTALVLGLVMAAALAMISAPSRIRAMARRWSSLERGLQGLERGGSQRPRQGRVAGGRLLGIALSVVAVTAVIRAGGPGPKIRFQPSDLAGLSQDPTLVERDRPFVHYRGLDAADEPTGDVICSSMAITDDIEGYGGPLNLLVSLAPTGEIRDLRLVDSRETPAYLVGFDDWIRQLRGLPLDIPIDPQHGEPIEGLTGATVTAHAALVTVDRVRRAVATGILDQEPPVAAALPSPWTRLPVLVLACLVLAAIPTLLSGRRRIRIALLTLSTLIAGLWLNQQLSSEHLAPLARLEWPSLANAEGLVLVGGALLLGLAFGPVYCGMLCPFGALQEMASSLGLSRRPGAGAERAARGIKYLVLVGVLILFLAGGTAAWLAFDPLGSHLGLRATGPRLALVILALAAALRYPRFWCRTLCPAGAALSLTNRLSLLRHLLPARRYDHCDLGVRGPGDWDCIQCNRCAWAAAPPLGAGAGAARPTRSSDRWLAVLLALAMALGGAAVWAAHPAATALSGTTRPADVDRIRQRIESRELSDHPAEFWEPADP